MMPYFTEHYGNASSVHEYGRLTRMAVDKSRDAVARFLGAQDAGEIIFTSGGTESDNHAILGAAYAMRQRGKHIVTSTIEHSAVLNTCKFLEKEGYRVTYVPVDEYGIVDLGKLKDAISDDTILVTIMLANNEIGVIEPIEEIAKIVKPKGITFHVDAVQAVGKIPVDVKKLGADLLSLSGHKFHGPKGIGALYVKKGAKITVFQHGGHQERNRRAGTENVPGIAGMGKAVELARDNMASESARMLVLRDRLYKGVLGSVKYVRLNGHPEKRLPNTVNIGFRFVEGESILLNLDMEGVAASTGSACTSGSLEPSHVLTAMNVDAADAQGSIRFSLGKDNTQEEIDHVTGILPAIIERLRKMSPLYNG